MGSSVTLRKSRPQVCNSIEQMESRRLLAATVAYVACDDGIVAIDTNGNHNTIVSSISPARGMDLVGSTLYVSNSTLTAIVGYDLSGNQVSSTPVPLAAQTFIGFATLSDNRFALFDNVHDRINFIDSAGTLLHTSIANSTLNVNWQNMRGIQLGDRLLVSEDGNMNVLSVDLTSYAVSIFKSVTGYGGLSDIAYSGGTYYVGTDRNLLAFTESGAVTSVGTVASGAICGIAIQGGYAYLASNAGEVYRMNLSTGTSQDWYLDLPNARDVVMAASTSVQTPEPLVITGTANADTITLVQSGDDLAVTVNSDTTHYSVSLIASPTINALGGNDTITCNMSIPATINGGAGDDLISGGIGGDLINGDTGNDTIYGDAGYPLSDSGAMSHLVAPATINGGAGNDLISGGIANDFINGNAGNDTVYGNGGADTIYGGFGNDLLLGGAGDDSICGQRANDTIIGGGGNDTLAGGAGSDSISGGAGDDVIRAHDSVFSVDTVDGGIGNDQVTRNATDLMLGCETDIVL